MAAFKPIKTTSTKLSTIAIKEGQMILCTDTGLLYFDASATSRVAVAGESDIAAGAVTSDKIAAGAVTNDKITDGTITKAKLATAVQTSLGKADSAVQTIATGSANGHISVDGTDVKVKGIDTMAYKDATKYLATDNTTAYTPSADYHPATKKYVDDLLEWKTV